MTIVRKRIYDLLDSQGNRIDTTFEQGEAVEKMYNNEIECYVAIETLYIKGVRQERYDSIDFFFTKEHLEEALKSGLINIT